MNAYEHLKRLIEDGYFDNADAVPPTGLHRLLEASGALMNTQPAESAISPTQRDALLLYWQRRQAGPDADAGPLRFSFRY